MLRPPSFATRGRELWRVDGLGDVHLACVPRPLWQVRVGRKRHSEKRKGRGSDGEEFAGTGGQGGRGVRARGAGDPVTRPGEVRIRVKACGICFSDHLVKDGGWWGLMYRRVRG